MLQGGWQVALERPQRRLVAHAQNARAIEDEHGLSQRGEHCVQLLPARIGCLVEPRVLERDAGARAELLGQLDFARPQRPARFGHGQGQRSDRPVAAGERDSDIGAQLKPM